MWIKYIILLIGSIISAVLYRLGGIGKPFNTKYRDLGCPLIMILVLCFLRGWTWWYISVFGLTFAALTTYWDSVFKFDNFWFHGFMIGIASFSLILAGVLWWLILLRAIILALGIGGWSKLIKNDVLEEGGRGFLIIATLPILGV